MPNTSFKEWSIIHNHCRPTCKLYSVHTWGCLDNKTYCTAFPWIIRFVPSNNLSMKRWKPNLKTGPSLNMNSKKVTRDRQLLKWLKLRKLTFALTPVGINSDSETISVSYNVLHNNPLWKQPLISFQRYLIRARTFLRASNKTGMIIKTLQWLSYDGQIQ